MIVWFDYGYNEHGHSLGGVGLQVPPFYGTKGMARHVQDKVWEHALAVKFKSENIQQALDATADCLVGAPCESSFCRFPNVVAEVVRPGDRTHKAAYGDNPCIVVSTGAGELGFVPFDP